MIKRALVNLNSTPKIWQKPRFLVVYSPIQGGIGVRIDRILGVVLSILVISYFGIKYFNSDERENNPFELIGESGSLDNNIVNLDQRTGNDDNEEIITYTNPHSFPVLINQDDITINCTGTGSNKEADELLVKNNYNIKARFSKEQKGVLSNELLVAKNEKVYIHVISEYEGQMPTNAVSCQYSLNITAS